MNLHTFPTTCAVCGGEGMGTLRTAAAEWDPDCEVVHTNPRVCRDNLRRQREES